MRRFKITPLTPKDEYWLHGYQVNLFLGDTESARYCYAALLFKRLNDPNEYNSLVELSDEEQQELRRELFDSINEAEVWRVHGRN